MFNGQVTCGMAAIGFKAVAGSHCSTELDESTRKDEDSVRLDDGTKKKSRGWVVEVTRR